MSSSGPPPGTPAALERMSNATRALRALVAPKLPEVAAATDDEPKNLREANARLAKRLGVDDRELRVQEARDRALDELRRLALDVDQEVAPTVRLARLRMVATALLNAEADGRKR